MIRLSAARIRQLAGEVPARYTAPLAHLWRARVLSGEQLDRLLTDAELGEESAGRVRRRIMARLAELGLVAALERRIGGVRAGSAGHVHVLTAAGYSLAALLAGQKTPGRVRRSRNPGPMFVAHALAIAEIYVQLIEASRSNDFRLSRFDTEPACWWPTGHGIWLKPDAYTILDNGRYQDCWWLEIDCGTESIPRIAEKCRTYHDHAIHGGLGPDDVLPNVLFTAPDKKRAAAIHATANKSSTIDTNMITVTTQPQATAFLITELHQT